MIEGTGWLTLSFLSNLQQQLSVRDPGAYMTGNPIVNINNFVSNKKAIRTILTANVLSRPSIGKPELHACDSMHI